MKFRIKPTRRNLAAFAAVIVAVGLGAFVLLDLVFANQLTPSRATALFEKTSPQLVTVLKADFAPDFANIVKAAVAAKGDLIGDDVGPNAVSNFLNHQAQQITKRFVDTARQAPPDLIVNWMNKLADTWTAVQAVAGPELCSSFVKQGSSALTDPAMIKKLAPAFDARDAALFVALAGARDKPVATPVGDATDADWQAVEAAMNGLEVPAGYAQIVATDNTRSKDYCSALSYYFKTIATLPGDGGKRLRAEYFVRSFS